MRADVQSIVDDMCLLDFYERKTNTSFIVGKEHFRNTYFKLQPFVEDPISKEARGAEGIKSFVKKEFPSIYKILLEGGGNLSLCVNRTLDLLYDIEEACYFDIYIHSCTVERAKELICKVFEQLEDLSTLGDDIITGNVDCNYVRFHLNIYKDKDEILRSIPSTPFRHGWDPIVGYFGTVCSAMSFVMSACPVDVFIDVEDIAQYNISGIKPMLYGEQQHPRGHSIKIINSSKEIVESIPWSWSRRENLEDDKPITLTLAKQLEIPIYKSKRRDPTNRKVFFSEDYKPITVGISDERYVAFARCREIYQMDPSLFHLLCCYWFETEVLEAKRRVMEYL